MANKWKVGVIGSGRISEEYLRNMTTLFTNLEVVACSASHLENAQKRAAQFRRQTTNNPSRVQDTRCAATSSEGEGCPLRMRLQPHLCRGWRGPGAVGHLGSGRDPRPLQGKRQGLCP